MDNVQSYNRYLATATDAQVKWACEYEVKRAAKAPAGAADYSALARAEAERRGIDLTKPAGESHEHGEAGPKCELCDDGHMTWCALCCQWSSTCCCDFGTCACN